MYFLTMYKIKILRKGSPKFIEKPKFYHVSLPSIKRVWHIYETHSNTSPIGLNLRHPTYSSWKRWILAIKLLDQKKKEFESD